MWLIKHEVAEELRRALKNAPTPTATQLAAFRERSEAHRLELVALTEQLAAGSIAAAAGKPRSLSVAGDTAEISVDGVLTPRLDFWLWLLDIPNTTYPDVQAALAIAAQDPTIKRVVLKIASPGGTVAGLFDTLAILESYPKPKSVRASLAASAAYAIAAMGGKIEATNAAAEFGSVGVVVTYLVDDELVDITSTEAPNKRPDPTTDEGKAIIREHLDAIHDLFVDAIARGRSATLGQELTKATVNETFGRGGVLLAGDAKKRYMIDKAPPAAPRGARAETETQPDAEQAPVEAPEGAEDTPMPEPTPTKKPLDLKTLRAEHPEAYEAAVQEGVKQERDRVGAHLTMGEQCGDMKIAIDAIKSGDAMTLTLQAKYMSAGMNRRARDDRQADSDGAGKVLEGAKPPASTESESLLDKFAADLPPAKKAS